jgi:hypothetical protein
LKKFGLNLRGKDYFKKKFEKKKRKRKEESLPSYLLSPTAHLSPPAAARLLLFLFSSRTLTSGPCVSASPLPFPFFLLSPLLSRPGAAAILAAPGRPSTFPSSLRGQLRQLISRDQLDPLPPFLKPNL